MGLSSKQVSSDGLDWRKALLQAQTLELHQPKNPPLRRQQQQNQQQTEPLKCPRCDSTNTKFCYYNNYNKSQPRHFCKTCKRHWTNGGTLRNVPVGGGRKNKRLKTSKTIPSTITTSVATTSTASATKNGHIINRVNPHMPIQEKRNSNLPLLALCDQKSISGNLYQALVTTPSSVLQQGCINTNTHGMFLGASNLPQKHQDLHFPYSGSFDTHQSSVPTSSQSSSVYNFSIGEAMEDSTITTIMPIKTGGAIGTTQPWQVPITSSSMDYWNWDDIDNFVSADINLPWDNDDSEFKP